MAYEAEDFRLFRQNVRVLTRVAKRLKKLKIIPQASTAYLNTVCVIKSVFWSAISVPILLGGTNCSYAISIDPPPCGEGKRLEAEAAVAKALQPI